MAWIFTFMVLLVIAMICFSVLVNNLSKKIDDDSMPRFGFQIQW